MKTRLSLFLAQNNGTLSGLVVILALVLSGVVSLTQAAWGLAIGLIFFGVIYLFTHNRK